MGPQDERTLLQHAQTSAEGFGELFDAYYDSIYRYAFRRIGSREAAEDIAASVFEDALKGIKRLRWQNKPLAAWLYKIASRRVADFYRHSPHDQALSDASAVGDGPGFALELEEEFAAVRRAMGRLGESDRELIRLVYFDELDRTKIAALLNCTTNNVYVRLHRALERLERILKDDKLFA